MQLISWNQ